MKRWSTKPGSPSISVKDRPATSGGELRVHPHVRRFITADIKD